MRTTCYQCGVKKRDILYTGSLLCDDCFEVFAEIMRMKSKGDKSWMTTKEKVLKMAGEGLKAKEIAEKLDLTQATVYYHLKARKEVEEKVVKEEKQVSAEVDYKTLYEKLKKEHKELSAKHAELELVNKKMHDELKKLMTAPNSNHVEDVYKQEYEREKQKHDALLQYVIALKGEIA